MNKFIKVLKLVWRLLGMFSLAIFLMYVSQYIWNMTYVEYVVRVPSWLYYTGVFFLFISISHKIYD